MQQFPGNFLSALFFAVGVVVLLASTVRAQSDHTHHPSESEEHQPLLTEPGNDVFGTIQEVIRELEADPDTDWSTVDLEALRQHLIDMRNFTLEVDVVSREPLSNGLQLVVEAASPAAATSLKRALQAHPPMLERETGWKMRVRSLSRGQYELHVTSSDAEDIEKIQGLGYIGLMASGGHHQRHHWMIATGKSPHDHSQSR
jgi:hypothetical protein